MGQRRWSIVLAFAALAALLAALLDPLEGFPLVLAGGALAVIDARLARSRWLPALGWGLGLAALGCAAMVWLSGLGGIGGSSGRSMAWGVTILPYPAGALVLLIGTILLIRQLLRTRQAG